MNTEQEVVLTDHIREHAARYFPGLVPGETRVQLMDSQKRPSAMLYRFKVTDGAEAHSIIVKVPMRNLLKDRANEPAFEKPLLFPKADEEEMHALHYTALVAIHDYMTGLNRKELGTIRVLDYLPESQAIVMEASSDPKLRDLVFKENRLRMQLGKSKLLPAFENVGTWLRIYHTMPKKAQVQVRHAHREDLVKSILKLTDFLAERLADKSYFDRLALELTRLAQEILSETLPLGLGHGDYALRNILVNPSGRVTVLDTFAKWRPPIYEDIGYFLTGLKMTSEQVASYGLVFSQDQLQRYEEAFLRGYFKQEPVPYRAIRLYEMLALLDKWSSVLISSYRRSIKLKFVGDMKSALVSLYFKRSANRLLKQIKREPTTAPSMDPERSY